MLRQRIISAGLAFLALSATQTQLLADGEPGAAAPSVSLTPTRWSGFYVGIGGGMGNVDQSVEGVASKFITVDKFKRHCYYFPYYHCTPLCDGGLVLMASARACAGHGSRRFDFSGAIASLHGIDPLARRRLPIKTRKAHSPEDNFRRDLLRASCTPKPRALKMK